MKKCNILLITSIIVTSIILTGCGSNIYEKSESGYTEVTTVKAASFEVPSAFLSQATAISSISENEEYDGLYVYKDGSSKYVLFDTSSVIIACGPTNFGFKGNESEETLELKSIEGIWMNMEKFACDSSESNGIYKMVADDVNADYSLTKTQYCSLKGSMATVSNGDIEYSIFAGAVVNERNKLTNDQEKVIKHVVRSLSLNKDGISEESIPEKEDDEAVNIPEEPQSENEVMKESESEPIIIEETPSEDVVEIEEKATEIAEETPKETIEEKPKAKVIKKEPKKSQKQIKAMESSTYSPLLLGQWGEASAFTVDGERVTANVRLDNIITGTEARDFIKKNGGRKTSSLEGTSFVVCEYSTDVSEKDAYIDLRFCGVDGERLKLRGISYTTRSYDIDNTEEISLEYEAPIYERRYAYYEVPTGCKEYMLIFGVHIKGAEDIPTANFLIE